MDALLIVDVQNDFCPGGALPVPEGDQVVPIVNRLQQRFALVVATQDWHPPNHGSFADCHPGCKVGQVVELAGLPQVLWPVHCVQNTWGAAFHGQLDFARIARVFQKGTDPQIDSYSGFFDNGHRKATGLGEYLKQRQVNAVYVCGLATDYCVKFTALDAVNLGFTTYVVEDACRGVELRPGDVAESLRQMRQRGVRVIVSEQIQA